MKLFFVLLFTVACNFYFEAATKETLEIFDIISSLEYSHSYPLTYKDVEPVTGDTTCLIISDGAEFLATPQNQRFWGQRRSSVAGLTEDDRQTVDEERQVGDPMQLRTEVLNL